ncbi:MAG: helix-turn-helix domain-containing protein [Micromonosporaceae bacterium]|nr:helix-turn-helix domain-containing protein [Micromonosporaceae bacterium]
MADALPAAEARLWVAMRDYKVKPVESLARGLRVLRALQEMRAASLHDLHLATGLPKSTLTRILYTCHQQGVVWQRMADGAFLPSYQAGPRRVGLGAAPADDADLLAEVASPVLAKLGATVRWPSVLSVPRLEYMEVVETNTRRAYFDELPDRPAVNFRANMLRSASGRAYLSFCPEQERRAVLLRLREHPIRGHELAYDPRAVAEFVAATQRRGYAVRAADFGGDYARPRSEVDDGRESIAMPIVVAGQVLGCVNITWRRAAATVRQMAARHAADLRGAATAIAERAAVQAA